MPFLQVPLDRRRELEQPQGVRDRRPALADPGRDVVVGEREVLDELLIGRGFFERVQLLALDVLDDRLLEHRRVVGGAHDRGDRLEPDPARRAPAALARDQLEAVAAGAHEDRLEHADLADRLRQRGERLLVEVLARLLRVRSDRRRSGSPAARPSSFETTPVGISAPSPLPSPPGRATAHLLRQLAVGDGSARRRIEHDDRLPERRRFRDPHRPRDDRPVDLGAEVLPHLALDLLRQLGCGRRTS